MKRISLLVIAFALAANAFDSTATSNDAARDAHRARIEAAITARDYDAWKAEREAYGARGQASQRVTRENFETFARMNEAMREGRTDEAAALRKELGLGQGNGAGMGQGKGARGERMGTGAGLGSGKGAGMGAGRGQGKRNGGGMGQGGGAGCRR